MAPVGVTPVGRLSLEPGKLEVSHIGGYPQITARFAKGVKSFFGTTITLLSHIEDGFAGGAIPLSGTSKKAQRF